MAIDTAAIAGSRIAVDGAIGDGAPAVIVVDAGGGANNFAVAHRHP